MNRENILKNVLNVFITCRIKTFPIDCFDLLDQYGYSVVTYQKVKLQSEELYQMCHEYSDESFRDGTHRIIAYNDEKPSRRIRFSLAHELGHHVLGHTKDTKDNEMEANYFASCLLAPCMAIHYCGLKTPRDVAQMFQLSDEASRIAFEHYQSWHRNIQHNGLRMTGLDKAFYDHFYDPLQKRFICSVKTCDFCGQTLYNSISNHCRCCEIPDFETSEAQARSSRTFHDIRYDDDYAVFQRMENRWLYGE